MIMLYQLRVSAFGFLFFWVIVSCYAGNVVCLLN